MKLKHLFLVAMAAIAFAACTNEKDSIVNPNELTDGENYMAISLVAPSEPTTPIRPSTKALGDEFEKGTEAEYKVSKALFIFFASDGASDKEQVAKPVEKTLEGWSDGHDSHTGNSANLEIGSTVTIVLDNKQSNRLPDELFVVLNPTADLSIANVESLKKSELMAKVADYKTDLTTSGKFVMTNSVYVNGEVKNGTFVSQSNIKKTEEEAKRSPVEVHVERVVSKVNVTDNTSEESIDPGHELAGKKKIDIEIDGWWIDNDPKTSYLVKNLDKNYTFMSAQPKADWWNDAQAFRSYWANNPSGVEYAHTTYLSKVDLDTDIYVNENTDYLHNPSRIVVSALLKVDVDGDPGTPSEAIDLFGYRSSIYDTKGIMDIILGEVYKKYMTKTVGGSEITYKSLTSEDIDMTIDVNSTATEVDVPGGSPGEKIKNYQAVLKFTLKPTIGEGTLVNAGDKSDVANSVVNDELGELSSVVNYWSEGRTYYFTNIVQNAKGLKVEGEEDSPLFGIVRNHMYKINLNSITGLGTPVANPDIEIDPVIPEEEDWYLAAKVYILPYVVVTQDVDLGK